MPAIETVLFDLDGTLLDTAPDLAYALNRVLVEEGLAPLDFAAIRPVVSHGAAALVQLGFGREHPDFEALRQRLIAIYRDNLARETRPFPGIEELLAELEARGLRWGVVTNKPAMLTDPLLQALGLFARAACVVSGDTLPQRKPDPAPMLYACRTAGSAPEACLYVGDAERDVAAGRAASMHTLVARFGYIDSQDDPEQWGADALVDTPQGILRWLNEAESRL